MSHTVVQGGRVSSLVFSSLKFHQPKVLGPMQALWEVMGLRKAMWKSHPETHGGGREAVVHRSHRRREGAQAGRVQFILQHHVILLLQASSLFCSAVLKPDFDLNI